ncbi:SH3-like domain-containing protein [Desulfoprunum benzoelyticum]|uniref:SH3-like domain-containing protein n=1 Tax=Desulfoprunum benzoelyticum TaxID=1506996 RepID=A0A840UML0_9BACT|nr:SH3 domain-containing protein [Desulfoprunum benzoelyticum]MBB5347507.1 SH3-like domain-containing protein [Desulfoprunum benzoelyticum]
MAEMLSVKSQKLNLRSGPGQNYSVKCVYSKGFPLKVLKKKGDWAQVRDFQNEVGWVSKQLLATTPHAIVAVNQGKKSKINIRSGPGTNFKVVGQAYYGVVFAVVDKKGQWRKIRHQSGLSGWIQQDLLWGT